MRIKDLTKNQILYALEEIEFKFRKAIVHPGEMCGILAAKSNLVNLDLGSKASFKRVRC